MGWMPQNLSSEECLCKGPSIKYVTLFLVNFNPPPLSHFVTHPGTPPKVRHTSRTPRVLEGLVQKPRQKPPCTRGFCPGVLSGGILYGRFCPGWFLSVPVLSEYIGYIRKLNITLNFMFRMYDKKMYKCDVTGPLLPLPLSQTVTPSRTPPSSVTYFMDGSSRACPRVCKDRVTTVKRSSIQP